MKGLCDVDNKEDKPPRTPPKKKLKKCPEMAPPAAIELDHFEAAVVEVENDEIIEVEPKVGIYSFQKYQMKKNFAANKKCWDKKYILVSCTSVVGVGFFLILSNTKSINK